MSYETDTPPPTSPLPPPPPPAPPVRRLVRDPYSRFGGVASGVAHYYGLDVSLVRLLFVILALSTGIGFVAYFLAWLIIPRADVWPPAGPPRPLRSLSNRDIGIGLALLGALLAIAMGGGDGGFIIPVVLIGGGVWLLLQGENSAAPAPADTAGYGAFTPAPPAPAPGAGAPAPAGAGGGLGGDLPPTAYAAAPSPGPVGAAVPPRSRRRRLGIGLLVGFLVAVVVLPLLAIGGLAIAIARGGIDIEGDTRTYTVSSAADLPLLIDTDAGDVVIDLSGLTPAELASLDEPAAIDARLDFGSLEVIVPDGIKASIDASTVLGDVELFGRTDDGFRNHVSRTVEDPDLDITLDVGAGQVVVRSA
ncbi:MAG: PspC domain-containing protein [Acidimicrobiia bacterium]|nr:PspC domain-containing protein [Acidimicrobiia bacterium]